MNLFFTFLQISQGVFLLYLIMYATFLLISLVIGGIHLHEKSEKKETRKKNSPSPAVSILVPAYNEEVTIVESLHSLLQQDYDHYEIIVIDDGSTDQTAALVRETFHLEMVERVIEEKIPCRSYHRIFEGKCGAISLTLIEKENGGKGDVLNLGINAARYDYFLCLDADSMLQVDSLKQIVSSVQQNEEVVAVGGLVQVAQGVKMVGGRVQSYRLPWQLIPCAQAVEYDHSFLGARILLDYLKSNLIISGAFGLFKKDVVIAAGGYDTGTLGEDMELVMKLHFFCRNNQIPYKICYETSAICWSQAPSTLWDLCKQRRRWFLGLFQCLQKYRSIFANPRFGLVGSLSYLYYVLFELCSPFIEVFGVVTILLSMYFRQFNVPFFFSLFSLYLIYCTMVTLTSFLQRAYAQHTMMTPVDIVKVLYVAIFRYLCLHWILSFVRTTSLIGYRKKKNVWGDIKREKPLLSEDLT